ncbi:MAG TPA: SdpI family protein [Usitatibacter sp.]|jgi:MFS family permease|nr:SdpI family protein [Usitatibacter sp.]
MLATVVLLLLCALTAIAGVPLILRLIPPNDYYGISTDRTRSRAHIWYEVNRIAGWSLVIAAALTGLALMIWTGTLLRPFWRQLLTYVFLVGVAVGTSFWYEREVGVNGRRWFTGKKSRSAHGAAPKVEPGRHAKS